ncbi:MAG: ribosome biogenesis GTPase Der [Rhodospirillaceae bacterium]|nr:ribosome biogenesis GTPase Der [Rhodospirillaceae bacterium]
MSGQSRSRPRTPEPLFTVAIVGRPNVGKSTLFNRLVGRRSAIVHDRPGVTRDRKEGIGTLAGLSFRVFDTAGLEDAHEDTLEGRMKRLTLKAVADADVALLLIDAKAGIVPLDEHFADLLRQQKTPVVLVANKCESKDSLAALYDAFRLGLGEPIDISAEHGQGLEGIYRAISGYAPPEAFDPDVEEPEAVNPGYTITEGLDLRPLNIAIVGRPNVGKSTLINRLIGEERQLTGPESGITRDAVTISFTYGDRKLRLVDTAGVRKRPNITDAVEKLSVGETFEALRMADVVVVVVDAEQGLDKQDLTLARYVEEEGRAIVIAVNKWDVVVNKDETLERIKLRLSESLAQLPDVNVVTMSATTGLRVDVLMNAVFRVHEIWSTHISTSALNRWLEATMSHHPPPLSIHKQRVKLRYMTQVKQRPPTFLFFTTRPDDLPESYMRYLANELRTAFDLKGVPIRLSLRKPKNPFVDDGDGRTTRHRSPAPKPVPVRQASTQDDRPSPAKPKKSKPEKPKGLKPRSLKGRAMKANGGKKVRIPRRRRY